MEQTLSTLQAEIGNSSSELKSALTDAGSDQLSYAEQLSEAPKTLGDVNYLLAVEAIYEGYLLHYGSPRLLNLTAEDIKILAGDYLYALGLSYLSATGNQVAVQSFAELIVACAQVHAADCAEQAVVFWRDSVQALGWDR